MNSLSRTPDHIIDFRRQEVNGGGGDEGRWEQVSEVCSDVLEFFGGLLDVSSSLEYIDGSPLSVYSEQTVNVEWGMSEERLSVLKGTCRDCSQCMLETRLETAQRSYSYALPSNCSEYLPTSAIVIDLIAEENKCNNIENLHAISNCGLDWDFSDVEGAVEQGGDSPAGTSGNCEIGQSNSLCSDSIDHFSNFGTGGINSNEFTGFSMSVDNSAYNRLKLVINNPPSFNSDK